MTTMKILDAVYPMTSEIRKCNYKRQFWLKRRSELLNMIDESRKGIEVDFSGLKTSVDVKAILISDDAIYAIINKIAEKAESTIPK